MCKLLTHIYKLALLVVISILVSACTLFDPVKIDYISYESIGNRVDGWGDDYNNQYGVFFKYDGDRIKQRFTEPLGFPLLGCKVELSVSGQRKTEYINGTINVFPIDNNHTYFAHLEFSYLNRDKKDYYKGYIFEDEQLFLIGDPSCRVIYKGKYPDYSTDTMNIPRQAITKIKLAE